MKKLIAIIVAILIAGGLVISGVKLIKKRRTEEAKLKTAQIYPIVVRTTLPQTNATLTYPYLALVKNDSTVTVTTKFAGKVKCIAKTGGYVLKGDIVAKIDDTTLKTNLKSVNSKIASIKTKLNAENIALKNLIATHKRTKALLDVKMASIEQYQAEETKLASLKAQIAADKNTLESLNAQKKAILNDLKYTEIKSPIDDVIAQKFVNKGDNAFPGKPLLTIASENGNYLFVAVPDNFKKAIYKNKMYNLIALNSTFNGVPAYKIDVNDKTLKSLINNINYPFKEAQELETALKKRLTKKEFKLLKELTLNTDEPLSKEHLDFDNTELERVKSNLIKKLNQEQTKQLLYNYSVEK
jgi:multidrug efflux pump subunit AcrA (membrane-fusion protein)